MGLENVYSVFCTFELHQEFLVIPHTLAGWQLKPSPKKLSIGHPSQVTGCGSPQAMDNHCAINYCSTLQRLIMILVPGDFSSLGSPHLGDSLPPCPVTSGCSQGIPTRPQAHFSTDWWLSHWIIIIPQMVYMVEKSETKYVKPPASIISLVIYSIISPC